MKLALVLFKGTGSVDRSLEKLGFHVDSLDIDPKCNATWTADILKWDDWMRIEPGTYDFIWASPPCQQYSRARTTAKTPRNLELADSIVAKTLQIIKYLLPKGFLMENPQTGLLKTREVVEGLPYRDVCYCRYSDGVSHLYRKQTRLWGFCQYFLPRELCTRKNPCIYSAQAGRHPTCAQRFNPKCFVGTKHTLNELYSMPEQLTDDIALAADRLVDSYNRIASIPPFCGRSGAPLSVHFPEVCLSRPTRIP